MLFITTFTTPTISAVTNIRTEKEEDIGFPRFDLMTIADATDNFSNYNKLGEGGFGPVYKVISLP